MDNAEYQDALKIVHRKARELEALTAKLIESEPNIVPKAAKPRSHLVRTVASLALLALLGYAATKQLPSHLTGLHSTQAGQVAGATTNTPATQQRDRYPEAYAMVPLTQTDWKHLADTDFGVAFDYPKNTVGLVREVGGSNIWLLRKDAYLLKISKENLDGGQDLAGWWRANQADYLDVYTKADGQFKGLPAFILTSKEQGKNASNQQIFVKNSVLFKVWSLQTPEIPDDATRLKRIIDSLQFVE